MKLIYIDDEQLNHFRFESELALLARSVSCTYFENASDALAYCKTEHPDIAFIDIEMPVLDGLALGRELQLLQIPFVFVTNHNDRAHEAFQLQALHYFTKPISAQKIEQALRRFEANDTKNVLQTLQHKISRMLTTKAEVQEDTSHQTIALKNRNKVAFLPFSSIMYLEASGSYTNIFMENGEKHIASRLLRTYEEQLKAFPDFIRIHKSYIVNRKFIGSIRYEDGKSWVLLTNNVRLELSEKLRSTIITLVSQS